MNVSEAWCKEREWNIQIYDGGARGAGDVGVKDMEGKMQGWCVPDHVSPTENSWMLRPLNKASLGYCVRCVPTLDRVKHGTSSVGRYRGLGRPPAPNGSVEHLAGLAYAPDQVYWIGTPPSDARSPLGPHIELHRFAALSSRQLEVGCSFAQSNQRDGIVRSGAK